MSSMETATKVAVDSPVETMKVVVEASVKAAGVVEATAKKMKELTPSVRKSWTFLERPHPAPEMA